MASNERAAGVPPRWFIRTAWVVHRAVYRLSGGRLGLRRPRPGAFGLLRLQTVGRHTGEPRIAILAYYADGDDLVLMAMNGWGDAEPAWWLNLQARPDAVVDLVDGTRAVRARRAGGEERARLWDTWRIYESARTDLDTLAALRSRETAVVVLEPR